MDERFEEVLGKYDFKVRSIVRVRGAFVLDTDMGIRIIRPWDVTKKKIEFEDRVTKLLVNRGYKNVDYIIENNEGMLTTQNSSGDSYVVKNWFWGDECRVKEKEDLILAAGNLGKLHKLLQGGVEPENTDRRRREEGLTSVFARHNREMKRVSSYIRGKKQKNGFELCILKSFDEFYGRAVKGLDLLRETGFDSLAQKAFEERYMYHGSYTYHNVLLIKDGTATVNFEKAGYGPPLLDLYYFLRKVMEKNSWNAALGDSIINQYTKENPMAPKMLEMLGILLYYPEKYWKIVNHYYNSKKSWVAEKDMGKLEMVCEQEWQKSLFLQELFSLSI